MKKEDKKKLIERLEWIFTAWLPFYVEKSLFIADESDIRKLIRIILDDKIFIDSIKNSSQN